MTQEVDATFLGANVRVQVEAVNDGFHAYPHQKGAWDAMTRRFMDDGWQAGLMIVPTGGGKTLIAARWLLQNHIKHGGRVLWLTHRRSLLRQAFHAFIDHRHLSHPHPALGLLVISSEDAKWSEVGEYHHIVLSSIHSARTEQSKAFVELMIRQSPQGLFVVVDEAHHAASPSYQRVLSMLKEQGAKLLGLTATPVRMDDDDNARLWQMFDRRTIFEIAKRELIEREILAQPHPMTVKTNVEMEREFTPDDYSYLEKFGELSRYVLDRLALHASRNKLIVDHYRENATKFGKTIVFAANTLHAQTLATEFQKAQISADYVDYTRGDSASIMDAFRNSVDPLVITNVEMLTEGYDAPGTQTVFIVRPTRSEALLSQMVGRALRGPKARGTEHAYLVTFVDTWSDYNVLDASFVIPETDAEDAALSKNVRGALIRISPELIAEAYKLVQSVFKGSFEGFHNCLPHSWYVWEEETDYDVNRGLVLVFENQKEGFEQLKQEWVVPGRLPEDVSLAFADGMRRRYFADCPDPQPSSSDLRRLLAAYKKGLAVSHYSFHEKKAFDPSRLAVEMRRMIPDDRNVKLQELFDTNPVCRLVYRGDYQAFSEEVAAAIQRLISGPTTHTTTVHVVNPVTSPLRNWPEGQTGYDLTKVWSAITAQKKHFPGSIPPISEITFSQRKLPGAWGFFRFSDRSVVLSPELNSPDVPLFVVEFMVYHELLHADMPNSYHNAAFRERERRFAPSPDAVADARERGILDPGSPGAWRALADQFLNTFHHRFTVGSDRATKTY